MDLTADSDGSGVSDDGSTGGVRWGCRGRSWIGAESARRVGPGSPVVVELDLVVVLVGAGLS